MMNKKILLFAVVTMASLASFSSFAADWSCAAFCKVVRSSNANPIMVQPVTGQSATADQAFLVMDQKCQRMADPYRPENAGGWGYTAEGILVNTRETLNEYTLPFETNYNNPFSRPINNRYYDRDPFGQVIAVYISVMPSPYPTVVSACLPTSTDLPPAPAPVTPAQ